MDIEINLQELEEEKKQIIKDSENYTYDELGDAIVIINDAQLIMEDVKTSLKLQRNTNNVLAILWSGLLGYSSATLTNSPSIFSFILTIATGCFTIKNIKKTIPSVENIQIFDRKINHCRDLKESMQTKMQESEDITTDSNEKLNSLIQSKFQTENIQNHEKTFKLYRTVNFVGAITSSAVTATFINHCLSGNEIALYSGLSIFTGIITIFFIKEALNDTKTIRELKTQRKILENYATTLINSLSNDGIKVTFEKAKTKTLNLHS